MKIAEYKQLRKTIIDNIIQHYGEDKLRGSDYAEAVRFSEITGDDDCEINQEHADEMLSVFKPWLEPEKSTLNYSGRHLMFSVSNNNNKKDDRVYFLVLEKTNGAFCSPSPDQLKHLVDRNITKINIVADMSRFTSGEMDQVLTIQKQLAAKNISVLSVATPADTAWHINGSVLCDFYSRGFKLQGKELTKLTQEEGFKQIASLLECPNFCRNKPGIAFQELVNGGNSVATHEKAHRARWAADMACKMNPAIHTSSKDFALAQLALYYKDSQQGEVVILGNKNDGLVEITTNQTKCAGSCVIL